MAWPELDIIIFCVFGFEGMNGVSKTLREFSCMVHAQVSDCMSDSIVILTIQWRDDFRCS